MDARAPFMRVFWGDYARDTGHLDNTGHGAYLMLIKHYWCTQHALPDDDAILRRIACCDSLPAWLKIRPIVAAFFQIGGGVWRHKRIDSELSAAAQRHGAQALGAQIANAKRNAKRDAKRSAERDAERSAEHDAERSAERSAEHDAHIHPSATLSLKEESKKEEGSKKGSEAKASDAGASQLPQIHSEGSAGKLNGKHVHDPARVLFTEGLAYLVGHGLSEAKARTLLGKWRQRAGDLAVIEAIHRASALAVSDPVAWIEAVLRAPPADAETIRRNRLLGAP